MALAYIEKIPTQYRNEFEQRVNRIARKYGFAPSWLMVVMNIETGGAFRPGLYQISGAVGLIQFTTVAAKSLNTNLTYLASLNVIEQLDWVDKYFALWKPTGKIKRPVDLYLLVFAPAFIGAAQNKVLYSAPSAAYSQNKSLDRAKKGYISVSDVQRVLDSYGSKLEKAAAVGVSSLLLILLIYLLLK